MEPWQIKLNSVLQSWQGTKFGTGQCCRGKAVDCRYFIIAVLDELYGISLPLPPREPSGLAVHNRPGAFAALRAMMSRYPCESFSGDDPQPGDVLIARPPHSHSETLQHAMIVGAGVPTKLWHAGGRGVVFTSVVGWTIAHAFRPLEKSSWALR
jgi:cell wall-associated NlpC family hydrolase